MQTSALPVNTPWCLTRFIRRSVMVEDKPESDMLPSWPSWCGSWARGDAWLLYTGSTWRRPAGPRLSIRDENSLQANSNEVSQLLTRHWVIVYGSRSTQYIYITAVLYSSMKRRSWVPELSGACEPLWLCRSKAKLWSLRCVTHKHLIIRAAWHVIEK